MEWNEVLLGDESLAFLAEVALRAAIMFVLVFATLRLMGKRAVKQLSVLELLISISLGSAAGDPMLYREVGVLKAVTVFMVALLFYGIIMKLITLSEKMERILEGRPIYIIRDGRILSNLEEPADTSPGADQGRSTGDPRRRHLRVYLLRGYTSHVCR